MEFKIFEYIIFLLQGSKEDQEHEGFLYKLGAENILNCHERYITATFQLLKVIYGEYGADTISWWLYEDVDDKHVYEEDGVTIIEDLSTIENLYKHVEEYRESKNFVPYTFKPPMNQEERMQLVINTFTNKNKNEIIN